MEVSELNFTDIFYYCWNDSMYSMVDVLPPDIRSLPLEIVGSRLGRRRSRETGCDSLFRTDAIIGFLRLCSQLELALHSGVVAAHTLDKWRPVLEYWIYQKPIRVVVDLSERLLPKELESRLTSVGGSRDENMDSADSAYWAFQMIANMVEDDPAVRAFVRACLMYEYDPGTFNRFACTLKSEKRFQQCIEDDSKQTGELSCLIRGFFAFMDFCAALHDFQRSVRGTTFAEKTSAYFSYWLPPVLAKVKELNVLSSNFLSSMIDSLYTSATYGPEAADLTEIKIYSDLETVLHMPVPEMLTEPQVDASSDVLGLAAPSFIFLETRLAAEQYVTATLRHEMDDTPYYNWGLVLSELYDRDGNECLLSQAIKQYKKAIQINGKNDSAYCKWGLALNMLYDRRRDESLLWEAISKFEEAVQINWNNDSVRWDLSTALVRLGTLRKDDLLLRGAKEVLNAD